MRTRQEIIMEFNAAEVVKGRLIMEIGQLYAQFYKTKDQKLMPTINIKIEAFQNVELHLSALEQELAKTE